jgi:hypothetical protein
MKHYSAYPKASIQMSEDPLLISELTKLAENEQIDYIFESGTYLGIGSTTFIANTFKSSKKLKLFYTLEINPNFYLKAKKNLAKFPFVKCLYGLSVKYDDAVSFIQNDEAILDHQKYDEIFIDDIKDPKSFYLSEIKGFLNINRTSLRTIFLKKKENVIHDTLGPLDGTLLVILDSAGGIGYLEFKKTLETIMPKREFYLLLDDIHHLKHFRSKLEIEGDKRFNIIATSLENGWLLAHYKV